MIAKIILAGMLAATLLSAQRGGGGGGRNRGGDMGGDMGMARSQNRLDMMESMLKLNKDQKKQVKSIMDEAQKDAAPLRDQIAKSESELGDAIAEGKTQEEIDKATASLGGLEAQMAELEMKAFAKIYQALDKEQQPGAGPVFFMMQGIFKGKNWAEVKQ
jgi:Spy/CpxP family protein refolding chaperone